MAQQNVKSYGAYSYNYNSNSRVTAYNSSAAPKYRPEPQRKPNLTLVQKTRKTAAQMRAQTAAETKRAIKVMVVAITILMFMAMAIFSRVQLDEINREINSVENQMKIAESDSIRINNELNSIISINNVEDYAINQLGMVKVQEHQVVYVDLSSDDYVSKVNGRSVDASQVINEQ